MSRRGVPPALPPQVSQAGEVDPFDVERLIGWASGSSSSLAAQAEVQRGFWYVGAGLETQKAPRNLHLVGAIHWRPDMLRHVTDDEIAQRVKVLRGEIDLQNQIRPDMMTVIERLTTSFRHFAYQQVPDSEMPDTEARWEPEGPPAVRESIVGAMQRGEPRARMAIANEIGHFAMRHSAVRSRSATQATTGKLLLEAKRTRARQDALLRCSWLPIISSARLIRLTILWTVLA